MCWSMTMGTSIWEILKSIPIGLPLLWIAGSIKPSIWFSKML